MKLYTEEQVMQAYEIGVGDGDCGEYRMCIEKLNLKPIELPSDEEIEKHFTICVAPQTSYPHMIQGAKWMRDKILNK